MGQTSNFVQIELLRYFMRTIGLLNGKQLRQTNLPKIDFSSHFSKLLVSLFQQLSLKYCFCVYSGEICVGVCFHLFCTKIRYSQITLAIMLTYNIFIIVEVFYIFDIGKVCLYDMCGFMWFLIWYTWTILIFTHSYFCCCNKNLPRCLKT